MSKQDDLTDRRLEVERQQSEGWVKPKQLLIEVTNKCNLRCVGCPINSQSGAGKHMDLRLFKSIIDRIDWDCTVVPWVNGEPLMHPDYYEMVKYVLDAGHKMYITTNGHYWNNELFELVTEENGCYQVIFSIDGIFPSRSQSIEKARPGSDRRVVYENFSRFRTLKLNKGNNLDLAVKLCMSGQDWQEVEDYIYGALTTPGVDYVCVGRLLTEKTAGMRIYPCQYPDRMFMVIRSDGKVVACAYHPEAHNGDYFRLGSVANKRPLLEVYNNRRFQEFRHNQNNGTFTGPCKTCGFAYNGHGFKGIIESRNPKFSSLGPLAYHSDYYNQFFTLASNQKDKPDEFYRLPWDGEA